MTDPKVWDCEIYLSKPEFNEEEARAIETLTNVYCDGEECDVDPEIDDPLDVELAIFITNAVRFARIKFDDRGSPDLFPQMVTAAEFFMDAGHLTCQSTRMSMPAYVIASLCASIALDHMDQPDGQASFEDHWQRVLEEAKAIFRESLTGLKLH